ncbi:MAG: ATP-grasp domain-containing protein, partial [Parvibaculales bacterium]
MTRALTACSIGILGSGQLGRMLAMAAYELGMEVHVFAPDADRSPAGAIAHSAIGASYEDEQALLAFADGVDCITYEFENIPADTVSILEKTGKLFPNAKALHIAQDRLMEKNFFQSLSIPHAEFQNIDKTQDLMDAFASESRARILKIRTLGYDGHGQWRVASQEEAEIAAKELNNRPAILEEIIPFTKELSVIIARERGGETAAYEASENIHENQILHHSKV